MDKKTLITNIKNILASDDELKKSRVRLLLADGAIDLPKKDIDALLSNKPKKQRRKPDGEEEK